MSLLSICGLNAKVLGLADIETIIHKHFTILLLAVVQNYEVITLIINNSFKQVVPNDGIKDSLMTLATNLKEKIVASWRQNFQEEMMNHLEGARLLIAQTC